MIDLLSLLLSNPQMTQQQMAQDGSYRTAELRPDDILMQELAKKDGAYSSPVNMANVSSAASLTPMLLHMLMMGMNQPAYGGGMPGMPGMGGMGGMPGMFGGAAGGGYAPQQEGY